MKRLTKQPDPEGKELTPCSICYMREAETCNNTDECWERAMYYKLAAFEDAEEQGLLVKLPCKIGDTLYCDGKHFASHCAGKILSFKVNFINTNFGKSFRDDIDFQFDFDAFGKTVFITREAAEAAVNAEKGAEHE